MTINFKEHSAVILVLLYTSSRVLLSIMGIKFHLDLNWMFMHDHTLLKDKFWESIIHTHAFNPGMNFITGLISFLSIEKQYPAYMLSLIHI